MFNTSKKQLQDTNIVMNVGDKVRIQGHNGVIRTITWLPNEARYLFNVEYPKFGYGKIYSSDINKVWVPLKLMN